ncbi:PREDICTED: uncharacterized protein LOC103782110, partial [Merops nubicus]
IAMPSDNCAKGTQDSCSSKTNVTIYHCKDCDSDICKLSDYEGFEKIVETQNNVFSNEKIQLVTSKTHISICFQEDPKGLYAIVWEKDSGTGDSCGILDSGVFSENVNGSFTGICCETETNLSVSNHPLKCHIKRPGGGNEKSTDIISVWEGHSISITCSMKDSETEVGTYLIATIQQVNVLYVSKLNTQYISPALANRIEYAKEGTNLRITLHDAQESDSNIYLCSTYIKSKGHHKKLNGKTTIVLVKAKTSGVVEQSPLYVNPQQGQSINITCALKSSYEDEGIYLLKTHMQHERVLYVSHQNASTIHPAFANRLEYSREEKKIVITLHNLQKNDSDIYVCAVVVKNSPFLSANGSGTFMLVKEVEQTGCRHSFWDIYSLIIMVVLLFSALVGCILYRVDMKKYFQKRKNNTVYEDMSYCSRRSTMVRSNVYFTDN